MRRLLPLVLLLLLTGAGPAQLISDLSQDRVEIEYSFAGARLLVYGAVQDFDAAGARLAPGLAIVVRGPASPIVVRKKDKVAGIWVNRDSVRFETAPGYYSLSTTAPVDQLVDQRTAAIYEIGLATLQISPSSGDSPEQVKEFEQGLFDLRRRAGLYREDIGGIVLTDNILYRAEIDLPSVAPVGDYVIEVHLVRDGEVIASNTRSFTVDKSGFERAVYVAAQEDSLGYGVVAVLIAMFSGWSAATLVRR